MKFIQIGIIGRPHGFRGEFVLADRDSAGRLPETIKTVYIGHNENQATPYTIEGSTWMPKGTRLKLEGFDTLQKVRSAQGLPVFVPRSCLPQTAPGEYYVGDLLGSEVRAVGAGTLLGNLYGIEEVGQGSPDRWWVKLGDKKFAIPATRDAIDAVDMENKVIWVHGVQDA